MSVANVSEPGSNADLSPSTVYSGVSRKGHPLILYKGFKYGIRKQFLNGNIKWICTLSKCSGSVLTDKFLNVFQEIGIHNHLPPPSKGPDRMNFRPVKQSLDDLKPSQSAVSPSPRPILPHPTDVSVNTVKRITDTTSPPKTVATFAPTLVGPHTKLYAALIMPSPNQTTTKLNGFHPEFIRLEVPQTGGGGQVGQSPGGGSPGPAPVAAVKKAVAAPPPTPAAPPEVCLRWNSYHSNMQATFPSLLNNEQFVDVTLACEGRSIKCHKVMLSACSSYFEELLSQNPCQHPIIFMRDLKFWEVQALVEFMYTGEVNVAQDKLPSLLTAAEALQIKGLTNPGGGGGGGGGSTGSYAASQEDDSNTTPDIDDVSSPSYCPPAKKIRKRKATNPTSYHQKAQAVYSPVTQQSSPISSPMLHQVTAPPALTPMRMISQPNVGIPQIASHATSQSAPAAHSTSQPPAAHPATQTASVQRPSSQQRIKKEPGSPQHSYLPPPHPPFTHIIKAELDDNMDTLLDLSESESRKESNATQPSDEPLSLATNDQGPNSNGSQSKAQDNGLSEDETGSDCSDSQSMHIDPGEASDA